MKRVFVTGATGFLGSHLVDRLLEKGWEIHALVRRSSNLQWLEGKKIQTHFGDVVGDPTGLREGLQGVDLCFHVAGVVLAARPRTYFEVNVQGTENLFEALLKVAPRIQRVVVVTSLAAHGPGRDQNPIREEDECHPITPYGESKREQERVVLRYRDRLPVTIIRPPAIYGPRDRQVFRYFWMAKKGLFFLPGDGKNHILNLAYVQDVITGLLLAAENPRGIGETFFVGDSRNYDWKEAALLTAQPLKKKAILIRFPPFAAYPFAGMTHLVNFFTGRRFLFNLDNLKNFLQSNWGVDIGKARRLLGYEPATPLQKGFEETLSWYLENQWL